MEMGRSSSNSSQEEEIMLVQRICEIYDNISKLGSLKPSKEVNKLFTQLVLTCIPPSPIDVSKLSREVQDMRSKLIRLCGEAEGLLESHFSTLLGSFDNPLDHVNLFPYYSNYLKLGLLEYTILSKHTYTTTSAAVHGAATAHRVAFVGSGPLPLTSIVLASYHMRSSYFHNYDVDPSANSKALRLVSSDPDLSKRMFFHTADIMEVTHALRDYDVVFLAALVGMDDEEKARVLDHLAKYMAPGAILMLRSAHGARTFLYPVVDPGSLRCFEVLSVFHPTDEVINSVVIARKFRSCIGGNYPAAPPMEPAGHRPILFTCKCSSDLPVAFNPLNHGAGNMIEELSIDSSTGGAGFLISELIN